MTNNKQVVYEMEGGPNGFDAQRQRRYRVELLQRYKCSETMYRYKRLERASLLCVLFLFSTIDVINYTIHTYIHKFRHVS